MKKALLGTLVLASSFAVAQQAAPQTQSKTTQAVPKTQAPPNPVEFDKQMAQLQANMKTMQEQMTKLQQTQDPRERQRLLQDHWATMQNSMTMMQGMWGPGMMGCCGNGPMMGGHMMNGPTGWHGMGNHYSKLTPEQLRQRQYMTDQYLGAQQMMMNHMMWHQQWMSQLPPAQK